MRRFWSGEANSVARSRAKESGSQAGTITGPVSACGWPVQVSEWARPAAPPRLRDLAEVLEPRRAHEEPGDPALEILRQRDPHAAALALTKNHPPVLIKSDPH